MRAKAPLIGMPARMDPGKNSQYLSRLYPDAVHAAGGVPVILPLLEDARALRSMADSLDGLLLTGSDSDVDPSRYGAERWPQCGATQPLRDATDFFLIERALERRTPILATCFGLQSLNVYLGGSLIQDISSALSTSIRHSDGASRGRPPHPVEIEPSSALVSAAGEPRPMVNSTHHQAADRVAGGLVVVARAPDGVVEALAGSDPRHWVLAVQWHPEKSFPFDEFSRNIFHMFIARCRAETSPE